MQTESCFQEMFKLCNSLTWTKYWILFNIVCLFPFHCCHNVVKHCKGSNDKNAGNGILFITKWISFPVIYKYWYRKKKIGYMYNKYTAKCAKCIAHFAVLITRQNELSLLWISLMYCKLSHSDDASHITRHGNSFPWCFFPCSYLYILLELHRLTFHSDTVCPDRMYHLFCFSLFYFFE